MEVVLNDLGPVALPRIGKKERFSKPCPRHREAGRRAGPHQYLSKPFHCGCCVGTCELCNPPKPQWSLTSGSFFIRDARGVRRLRLLQTRTWPSAPIPSATGRPQKICLSRSRSPTPRVNLSIANCTPTADVTPRRIVCQRSIRHSRFSSSKCLEQFLKSATNCGCLARVPSQKMACARGWRRVM